LQGSQEPQYLKEPIDASTWEALIEEVTADLKERGWRVEPCRKGIGCTNPEFNETLVVKRPYIPLRLLPSKWQALDQGEYNDLEDFVLGQVNDSYFNGDKIRLCGDLPVREGERIAIQETDYLSSLMTDQLTGYRVRSIKTLPNAEPANVLWDGVSAFVSGDPKNRHRLKSLQEAQISNQLGGSTLAFSSDGHLMIVYQSKDNLQSINLLAPSGSGSLDWKADALAVTSKDLISLVEFGVRRELQEECALDAPDRRRRLISSSIKVIAFARMIHRGGKPEFFCLSRIGATAGELQTRKPERYVESILPLPSGVDPVDWSLQPTQEIARVCSGYLQHSFEYKDKSVPQSYPLEHALKLVIDLCGSRACVRSLDEFLSNAPG
jgi:hypothetical protein